MSTQTKEFDRIWLQTCGDSISEWFGEITWCQDKINDDDIEYVNARLHTELLTQLAAERERADYAWRNANVIEKARQEEMAKRDALLTGTAALKTTIVSLLEILRQWEPDWSSGEDRRTIVLAMYQVGILVDPTAAVPPAPNADGGAP